METYERVVGVLKKMDYEAEWRLSTSFTRDLNADSLDLVEIVMAMEEEFGQEVPEDDRDSLTSVADVVQYINKAVS